MKTPDLSTRQSVKRIVDVMTRRLNRDRPKVSYPDVLEAMASAFTTTDWNTLSATLGSEPSRAGKTSPADTASAVDGREQSHKSHVIDFTMHSSSRKNPISLKEGQERLRLLREELNEGYGMPQGERVLVHASPGKGKSVLLSRQLMLACLRESNKGQLPMVSVTDIGHAYKGMLPVLADLGAAGAIHAERILYADMSISSRINPFDTPLGFRAPDARHRRFLVRLVCIIGGNAWHAEMAGNLIDQTYSMLSDRKSCAHDDVVGTPRLRMTGVDSQVDKALLACGAKAATWWQAVDALFANGDYQSAVRAQRQAVPTLSILNSVLNGFESGLRYAKSESLFPSHFPWLDGATNLDTEDANFLYLNIRGWLGHLIKGTSQPANSMVIWNLATRRLMPVIEGHDDKHLSCPVQYISYHRAADASLLSKERILVLDDLHVAGSSTHVMAHLQDILCQGRQTSATMMLASQLSSVVDVRLVREATQAFLCGCDSASEIAMNVHLTKEGYDALERLDGPRLGQGAQYVRVILNGSIAPPWQVEWQVERTLLSSRFLLMVLASTDDMELMESMTGQMDTWQVVEFLTTRFPKGAYNEIMRRKSINPSRPRADVILEMAEELLKEVSVPA